MRITRKKPLSGNSMANAGHFVHHTKTIRNYTYTKKTKSFLVHKFVAENRRRTCERNLFR